jgi:hypothetical protein
MYRTSPPYLLPLSLYRPRVPPICIAPPPCTAPHLHQSAASPPAPPAPEPCWWRQPAGHSSPPHAAGACGRRKGRGRNGWQVVGMVGGRYWRQARVAGERLAADIAQYLAACLLPGFRAVPGCAPSPRVAQPRTHKPPHQSATSNPNATNPSSTQHASIQPPNTHW